MNYRHSYHAGNFADVFKHIILVALLESLLRKEKSFCFLDTHAGIGYYNLLADTTQKKKEFLTGIAKLQAQQNPPALIQRYLDCVRKTHRHFSTSAPTSLQYYPGSPYLAHYFLRPEDRMILCELHEDDCALLKNAFPHDPQVAVHHQDGYQALKAFLPPKERRGLILIDPPYENPNEFIRLNAALPAALARFETGIYALWYPIKKRESIDRALTTLKQRIHRPVLTIELSVYAEDNPLHLNGSGMLIINPPWQLDQQIRDILPWLWETLSVNQQGHYYIDAPL